MWEKVRKYINGYLNQTHIQSLRIFQNLLQQSNQIYFLPQKLATYKPENNLYKKKSQQLLNGLNKHHSISIVILRSINSNNFTFLLATQALPTFQLNKYIFIVVVWPKQQDMINRWKQQLSLNMWVTIRQPFKLQRQDKTTYLIVRLENLVIEQGKRWKQKSQSVKQKANLLFKNKNFIEAFIMYEFALSNNHDHTKSYQRAILYSNSAACLYQLRLFSSSILYSDLAIKASPTYAKGYTRKFNSLLQLSKYPLVPPCLMKLKTLISGKQFQFYNQKFTNYLSNDIGIYNWLDLCDKKNTQKYGGFGQYHNAKIQIRKVDGNQCYVAKQDITNHQLILVNKPFLYFNFKDQTPKTMKENYQIILDQVKKNCLIQKSFYQYMKLCPPFTNSPIKNQQGKQEYQYDDYTNNNSEIKNKSCSMVFKNSVQSQLNEKYKQQTLTENQLKQKIQLSLFMERFLQSIQYSNTGCGLWIDLFYFPLNCEGNCTYIHLKNSLLVFSAKEIKKGQTLSIDFLAEAEALSRTQIMQKNYNKKCQCMYCSLQLWPQDYNGDIQGLYQLIDELPNIKTKKQMIRQIIFKKAQSQAQSQVFDSIFPGIIYKYLIFVQKDPHWQDITLLLRILRDQYHEDTELSKKLQQILVNCFLKYLKIPYQQEILQLIQKII